MLASRSVDTFQNFINGEWKRCSGGACFENENPAVRGSNVGLFQASTVDDVKDAIDAAHMAFKTWRRTPVGERQGYVAKFLNLLKDQRENLARIVTVENGKTLREARAEIDSALLEGSYHFHQVVNFAGHTGEGAFRDIDTHVRYMPLGVVGVISPWNFPVNIMSRKTLPALLTGNTVVFKPATFTPWSGIFMSQLLQESGLPPGVFNCVTGLGSKIGNAFAEDPRIRAITFTGSTEVGKQVQAKAAKNLTRMQLELGGKNALIVMDDADIMGAVNAAALAGFSNAGQWCTSTSRILLHRNVAEQFLDALIARCESMKVGDGLSDASDIGPVAGPQQFEDISEAIKQARSDGAKMVAGGEGDPTGYFIRPTVLTQVNSGMAVFRDEIFGPVVAVTEFDDLDEAIELANCSIYGLSSSIYTKSLGHAKKYIDRIDAGLAHVNVHTGYKEPSMPFGGVKQSGAGLPENSRTGLEFFIDYKAVYVRA